MNSYQDDNSTPLELTKTNKEKFIEELEDYGFIKTKKEEDLINNPQHYTNHPSGIECIEVTEHFNFNIGNAIKYLWRADEKDDPEVNLEKAKWYINRELQRRKNVRQREL